MQPFMNWPASHMASRKEVRGAAQTGLLQAERRWETRVQFSRSVMSDSATSWTAACQASLSITSSQRLLKVMSIQSVIHPTISSSVVPFSSCLQSFPASGSFPMSWPFASDGQSIGIAASTPVLPMNIQDWFPLRLTGWILQSKGLSRVLQYHSSKASVLLRSAFRSIPWLLEKP